MPKKTSKDNREEILQQKVGPGGTSSPALDAMHSDKFVEGSNKEAAEIAMAVVKSFGGNIEKILAQQSLIMERMDRMDREAEKYEADRKAWLDEIRSNAEKLKVSDAEREKMEAQTAVNVQHLIEQARAELVMDRKKFEEALRREPQVEVISGGKSEIIMEGGVPVAKLYPEEMRVKHLRFILRPGVPTMLPKSIADAWKARKMSELETQERQAAMKKNMEVDALDATMKAIDKKYGSMTSHLGEDQSQIYKP